MVVIQGIGLECRDLGIIDSLTYCNFINYNFDYQVLCGTLEKALKKHPGIVFTIWSTIFLFLLGFELSMLDIHPFIRGSISFFCFSICFWWITYFHVRWIEKLDQKYYKKEKMK